MIMLPSLADCANYLRDAGVQVPSASPFTNLAWARDSLVKATDPDTWATVLDAALLLALMSLHTLLHHQGASTPPLDARRLADVITLYLPDVELYASSLFCQHRAKQLRRQPLVVWRNLHHLHADPCCSLHYLGRPGSGDSVRTARSPSGVPLGHCPHDLLN
jgi:hypothetical protein